jgi:hypothetical protein
MGATESVFEDTTEPASTSANAAASVGQSRDSIPSRSRPNGASKTMAKPQKRRPLSQAKPIKRMEGVVLGCPKTGKRTLLKRLEGIDPFTINNNKANNENNKIDDNDNENDIDIDIDNSTEPSFPSITIPYKPPLDSTTWDRIKLRVQYANNNFDDNEKMQQKNKIDFVVILINPKHPREMTKSHLTNVLHSYLDLLGHLTDNAIEKEKEKMESSSSSKTSSTTNITEPFCMVILFNFRDHQKEEGKDEISHPAVTADTECLVRETLRSRNVPEENIVLDLLETSLRNCYGLDGLHRFIYRTYLQRCRADIEKQLNIVQNRIQITDLVDIVPTKYDEFIEEITPKEMIEPQRATRRSLKLQSSEPQGQTSSARMGKEALEAFLASSSDEEDEPPITNKGTTRSSKKFGSAFSLNIDDDDDDDDDDIFYDESGNRQHNRNQKMPMSQMNGGPNNNEEEDRSIQSSHSSSSENIKLQESPPIDISKNTGKDPNVASNVGRLKTTSKSNVPERVETQQTSEKDDKADVKVEKNRNEVAKTKEITKDQKEIETTTVREEKEEIKVDAHETSKCSGENEKEKQEISDNLQKMQVTKTGKDQEVAVDVDVDVDVDHSDDINCENDHDDDNDNDEKDSMISGHEHVEEKVDDNNDGDDEGEGHCTTGTTHANEASEKDDVDDDDDDDDDYMIGSTHANVSREKYDDDEDDEDDDDYMIGSPHANVATSKDDDDNFMISSTPVEKKIVEDDSDDESGYMIQSTYPVQNNKKTAGSLSSTKLPINNDSIQTTSSVEIAVDVAVNKNSNSVSISHSDDKEEESQQKDEDLTLQPSNSSLSAAAVSDNTADAKPVATSSGISAAALAAIAAAQQEAEAMMQQQQQHQYQPMNNAASHLSPTPIREKKSKKHKKKKDEKDGEKKKKKKKKTKVGS